MDFKALMTKLETINKRQVLNESVENTKPAPKIDKQVITESPDMKSSIARMLMQEFGVNEEGPNDDNIERKTPVQAASGGNVVDSEGNPVLSAGSEEQPGQAANPPGEFVPPTTIGADDADAGGEDPGQAGNPPEDGDGEGRGGSGMGTNPPVATSVPVNPPQQADSTPSDQTVQTAMAGDGEGRGEDPGQAANPPDQNQTVDPAKVNRFKELLDKLEGGKQQPTPSPASGGSYVIKPGDNLTKIAKTFNTTINDLMKMNPQIKDPNKIFAGAKMTVPQMKENIQSDDDYILSMIKSIR
jgi:LysM repeat protein